MKGPANNKGIEETSAHKIERDSACKLKISTKTHNKD